MIARRTLRTHVYQQPGRYGHARAGSGSRRDSDAIDVAETGLSSPAPPAAVTLAERKVTAAREEPLHDTSEARDDPGAQSEIEGTGRPCRTNGGGGRGCTIGWKLLRARPC